MRTNQFLFVTGTTGSLGVEIVRLLLHRPREREVRLLIRADSEEVLHQRWQRVLSLASGGQLNPADVPHLIPIRGDILKENLGIGNELLDRLRENVTEVIHAAADTHFLRSLPMLREANVKGTRNVLSLARACKNLVKIAHISSLFVAGRRSGLILEDELEHDCRFVSRYEETKYESEVLVRQEMKALPIAVYRLALLTGHSESGYVHEFGGFHQALRFYYSGLLPLLPGFPQTTIDLLPIDYAAKVVLRLFDDHFSPGTTYHISAGKEAIALKDLLGLTTQTFSRLKAVRKEGRLRSPEIVNLEKYESYIQKIWAIKNTAMRQTTLVMSTLVPHLVLPKTFENQRMDVLINESVPRPNFQEYFPKVLSYCVETGWGRELREEKNDLPSIQTQSTASHVPWGNPLSNGAADNPLDGANRLMTAVVWEGPLKLKYCMVPRPELISDTDAIIRVCYSTICGTDLHAYRGSVPNFEPGTIPGHEFVGVVQEVGAKVSSIKKGGWVFSSDIQVCGQCRACWSGRPTQCEKFRLFGFSGVQERLDGGMAQYVRIPFADTVLTPIPEGVHPQIALLASDVLPVAFSALEAAEIGPDQTVAVLGCGPIGLAVQMLAVEKGARVFGIDPIQDRLNRAARIGSVPLNPFREEVARSIAEATTGQGADVVIEAVGGRQTFAKALEIVRPQGKIIGVGAQKGEVSLNLGHLLQREIRLFFVIGDPIKHRDRILERLTKNPIALNLFFSHCIPLSRVPSVCKKLANRQMFKIVITFAEPNVPAEIPVGVTDGEI